MKEVEIKEGDLIYIRKVFGPLDDGKYVMCYSVKDHIPSHDFMFEMHGKQLKGLFLENDEMPCALIKKGYMRKFSVQEIEK